MPRRPGNQPGGWSALLAWLALVLAAGSAVTLLAAGPGTRWGWWPFGVGFRLLRGAAQVGLAAAVLGGVVAGVALVQRRAGLLAAAAALLVGLTAFGVPWWLLRQARAAPPIHDVTTDPDHPPVFVAILPLRRTARNPAEYGGPAVAAQQRRAYPDLAPADVAAPPARVLEAAVAVAHRLGWTVVAAVPAEGRLEATATTPWFGFKDDVVVRVVSRETGSRVDVRSVSRVGVGDLGTNAARIRRFLRMLGEELAISPR